MKKIFLTASILLVVLIQIKAQTKKELEFNEVRLISLSSPVSANCGFIVSQSITIPADKIWKIESANTYLNFDSSFKGLMQLNLPGVSLFANDILLSPHTGVNAQDIHFPIWLPAGTYLFYLIQNQCGNYGTTTINGQVSAIEFNVVQY